MQKRITYILIAVLLPLCLYAQEQEDYASNPRRSRASNSVYTGISGGVLLHGGYLFADSPDKIFSNTGLGSYDYVMGLPRDGFCYGIGGTLRVHLINHIHIGGEYMVSTMPLMNTGSNVRTGWGGACIDVYANWGKVRPLIGGTIGGGTMKRLYVPKQEEGKDYANEDETKYNASYTKTPFFMLDPYIGMEIGLTSHLALMIRIDYLLPFGNMKTMLTEGVNWSYFMAPSGPRLYMGIMFGDLTKK
ncbi:MAG: hypothetical protein K6A36_07570 [Paludibacteraceae bacterium]|nr:hypothetical protein [Paludibacteraceae bacterium]